MTPDTPRDVRLYTQKLNPYSEKVAGALALKRMPFQRIVSEDPADVARWSPIARTLPVLEVDGRRKSDSAVILDWLDELQPDPPLYARDPKVAEAQRHLADWSDTSFTWYWNRWRTARFPRPGDADPVDPSPFRRLVERLGRSLGHGPMHAAEVRELEVVGALEARIEDLVGFLRDRPFFHADEPSGADLAVYAMLHVLRGGPIPHATDAIEARPSLTAFMDRMEKRLADGRLEQIGAPR